MREKAGDKATPDFAALIRATLAARYRPRHYLIYGYRD